MLTEGSTISRTNKTNADWEKVTGNRWRQIKSLIFTRCVHLPLSEIVEIKWKELISSQVGDNIKLTLALNVNSIHYDINAGPFFSLDSIVGEIVTRLRWYSLSHEAIAKAKVKWVVSKQTLTLLQTFAHRFVSLPFSKLKQGSL